MSSGRYYFPELPADDALCVIANLSKQTLREGERIVEILRKNYSILYEQSPRKASFLMEENDKSIFDFSPNTSEIIKQQKGNISSIEQSSEQMSTPVSRNSCLPRKYLSIDEAEKECTDTTEAIDALQKMTICHEDVNITISKPSDDESATADKVVVTPSTSKSPNNPGSPQAENKESPRSAETVAMFTNLNLEEEESSELVKTNKTDMSATNMKFSGSPHQITENYQPSSDLNEEKQISNLITEIEHTPSPIKKSKISDNPATDTQVFISPTGKSDSNQDTKVLDSLIKGNKTCESPIKWNKSVEVTEVKRKIPSPRSNALSSTVTPKICSIRTKEFDIELPREADENSSPTTRSILSRNFKLDETVKSSKGEIDNLKDNIKSSKFSESKDKTSPKITDPQLSPCEKNTCSGSPTSLEKGNKLCSTPIKWNKSVEVAEVKRKSPSPRSNTSSSTITPKIICSIRVKEFDIELPREADENSSPTTRRNLTRDLKLDETVKSSKGEKDNLKDNIKSSKFSESKGKISPKITDPQLSPCEKSTGSGSPTSLVKGNKICSSPIKWNKSGGIAEVKKSPSPRRNTLYSKVTPKIICSIRIKDFDIELPEFIESKSKTSPTLTDHTCSGSPMSQMKRGKENQDPEKSKSPPVVPSKIATSPKSTEHHISPIKGNIFESPHKLIKGTSPDTGKNRFPILYFALTSKSLSASLKTMESELSHSEKQACIEFPQNVTEVDSSSEDADYAHKNPSSPSTSSYVGSCSEQLKTIETSDYNIINTFRNKLTRLISVRDEYTSEIFENFSKFQKELHFLFIFVKKIVYVVKKLQTEGKEYVTKEFEDVASELTARAFKLEENLNLWKSSGDSEVQTWIQYFEEIKHMKSNYETRINSMTSPVNCIRMLRDYEKNLKSVWKKMIDMKNVEDTRRSSLINSSLEFEMLTKQFVKCLVIVGIVKPQSETAFT